MSSAIARLGEDDNGKPEKSTRPTPRSLRNGVTKKNQYSTLNVEESTDAEDSDFGDQMVGLQSASNSDSELEDRQMTNEEVLQHCVLICRLHYFSCCFQLASILPRKTVAERGPAAHSLRAKKKTARKQGGPSVVFKGPVRSGFLAKNGLTGTVTGLLFFQISKDRTETAKDRKIGLLRSINRLVNRS
jgi:hypothetical protein